MSDHPPFLPRWRALAGLCLWLLCLWGSFWVEPAAAEAISRTEYAEVELVTERAQPAAGQAFTVALAIRPKSGWHSYWENPGGAGQPVSVEWQLPAGAEASALRYPAPKIFKLSGIVNHVVDAPALLLSDIQLPATMRAGEAFTIAVQTEFLVCDDKLCVPQSAQLTRAMTVGDGQIDPANAALFAQARAALPLAPQWPAQFTQKGTELRIALSSVPYQDLSDAHVFTISPDRMDPDTSQRFAWVDGSLHLALRAPDTAPQDPLAFVLRLQAASGGPAQSFALVAEPGTVPPLPVTPAADSKSLRSFVIATALAIVGGLLLNLMPCVFPIFGAESPAFGAGRSG